MDGDDEGGGPRLSKRFSDKGGEVDYKTTSGTAWSHSYLNQKPWHPLSYPNQRRKWIAEQSEAQHRRRAEEVAREFAQEQEFFRQTALVSKKEKEKVEMMKAVSFMYIRPPGYNPESAKAAELEDERKKEEDSVVDNDPTDGPSTSMLEVVSQRNATEEKKKNRPKDVFGRALPTEQEFEVLKNAPRLDTGMPGRVKPFGVEVRNVKCVRCSMYGHQSGDRECPLKDAISANEESRLKRDDPLTAIVAQTDSAEPLKWELKHKPGMSPPRGGFRPDDPNQQIVAEDIFDEYGGFLSGGGIPDLLADFSTRKSSLKNSGKKSSRKDKLSKSKHGTRFVDNKVPLANTDSDTERRNKRSKKKKEKNQYSLSSGVPDYSDSEGESKRRKDERSRRRRYSSSSDHEDERRKKNEGKTSRSSEDERRKKNKRKTPHSSEDERRKKNKGKTHSSEEERRKKNKRKTPHSSEDERRKKKRKGKIARHDHVTTSSDDLSYEHHPRKRSNWR